MKPSLGLCRWVREHEESVGECFLKHLPPFLVWVAEKQQASLFTTLFVCVFALHGRLRVLGLQLMERMLHFSPQPQIEPLLPLLLDRVLKLVEDPR